MKTLNEIIGQFNSGVRLKTTEVLDAKDLLLQELIDTLQKHELEKKESKFLTYDEMTSCEQDEFFEDVNFSDIESMYEDEISELITDGVVDAISDATDHQCNDKQDLESVWEDIKYDKEALNEIKEIVEKTQR